MHNSIVGIWNKIEDGLPEVILTPRKDGLNNCNFVFIRYKNLPDGGSQYQTSNTIYVRAHSDKITHWAYIVEP